MGGGREVILGFPPDYIFPCMSKKERKQKKADLENKRLTMLGNTWSVPVVALLLKGLLGLAADLQKIFVKLSSLVSAKGAASAIWLLSGPRGSAPSWTPRLPDCHA